MITLQAGARASAKTKQERISYLDWLRVLTVLGVFYFHTARVFDFVDWNVKNTEQSFVAMLFIAFFSQWGIPLFFVLAGASSWFALRTRSPRRFIRERCLRLLVPLVVGVLLFSPPQAYVEALTHGRFQGSFFQFFPWFFAHIQVSWHLWWIGAYAYHLWFLAFLLLFTLLALPLFLFLRGAAGQRFVEQLAAWCAHPAGIWLFIVPIAAIQVTLRAAFPLYTDWADFVYYFAFFISGYLLFSKPSFAEAIRRHGRIALGLGIACFLIIAATYFAGYLTTWETSPSYSIGYLLYQLLRSINTWAWLVFVLAFGMRFLNANNKGLRYANEAVLPFFVLQQPLIIGVAFYVVQWNLGVLPKWLIISALALALTLAFFELLIRRVNAIRWLFGMKPRHRLPGDGRKNDFSSRVCFGAAEERGRREIHKRKERVRCQSHGGVN